MAGPKKFSNEYLKQLSIDAHEVKDSYGCYPVAHYDIYNGPTVTIRDKNGDLYYDTGMTKEEFIETWSDSKGDYK